MKGSVEKRRATRCVDGRRRRRGKLLKYNCQGVLLTVTNTPATAP